MSDLREALARTDAYLVREDYRGYDPYDALTSPLFRLPVLRSAKPVRFGAQQVLRRLPFNVRPLLGIRKGYNPVTVALAAQAYAYLARADEAREDEYRERVRGLVAELERLRSPGYDRCCWGYDFDWEARGVTLPAWTPTSVATGFVTNALHVAWELLGDERALALCESACSFFAEDLNRTVDADGAFCWSYSPRDRERVLNATMKGARLLGQVAAATGRDDLRELAAGTIRFVVRRQRADGSWPYSDEDPRVDGFHTGYVLDALADYESRSGDLEFAEARGRGYDYYRSELFDGDVPRYYDRSRYPIDATNCAQAVITLAAFGDVAAAERTARWGVETLQRPDGSFAYRVGRRLTIRIPYVRWSAAWMLCALARVVHARVPTPV